MLRAAACLETKDIETFIQTAARCPDFRFVLALVRIAHLPDLPERFVELNRSLGSPVEMRFDVQYPEMAELTRQAGVYLFTFGFVDPFGMPMSIIEAMASGAIVLLPDAPATRRLGAPGALYYAGVDGAVSLLADIQKWTDDEWRSRSNVNSEHAYRWYADEIVLPKIVEDWLALSVGKSE